MQRCHLQHIWHTPELWIISYGIFRLQRQLWYRIQIVSTLQSLFDVHWNLQGRLPHFLFKCYWYANESLATDAESVVAKHVRVGWCLVQVVALYLNRTYSPVTLHVPWTNVSRATPLKLHHPFRSPHPRCSRKGRRSTLWLLLCSSWRCTSCRSRCLLPSVSPTRWGQNYLFDSKQQSKIIQSHGYTFIGNLIF